MPGWIIVRRRLILVGVDKRMGTRILLKVLKKHYAQSNQNKDVFDFEIDYERTI